MHVLMGCNEALEVGKLTKFEVLVLQNNRYDLRGFLVCKICAYACCIAFTCDAYVEHLGSSK